MGVWATVSPILRVVVGAVLQHWFSRTAEASNRSASCATPRTSITSAQSRDWPAPRHTRSGGLCSLRPRTPTRGSPSTARSRDLCAGAVRGSRSGAGQCDSARLLRSVCSRGRAEQRQSRRLEVGVVLCDARTEPRRRSALRTAPIGPVVKRLARSNATRYYRCCDPELPRPGYGTSLSAAPDPPISARLASRSASKTVGGGRRHVSGRSSSPTCQSSREADRRPQGTAQHPDQRPVADLLSLVQRRRS